MKLSIFYLLISMSFKVDSKYICFVFVRSSKTFVDS